MTSTRDLATLLSELDETAALETVRQRLAAGESPMTLVDECRRGMRIVGEMYEQHVYYISALIIAGEILREILELLGPHISRDDTSDAGQSVTGTMIICTVKGDIHDVGKDIAASLLTAYGLEVVDLGVDVAPNRLVAEVAARQPDVVGLSGLITQAYEGMKSSVAAIREWTAGSGAYVPVILGGSSVTQQVCDYVGADRWCADAVVGVRLVRELLGTKD